MRLSDAVALWRVGANSRANHHANRDPLIDQALDELGVDRGIVANPQRAALTAVLKRYKRGGLTAAAAAQWAHRYIGHQGHAASQIFVDFDDMYDTVNYASYTVADLDERMAEETDAFLPGRASPGRTRIWRPGEPSA